MVTHDLAVVAETCQNVTVLYAGRDVETGPVEKVLHDPKHPYTIALLEASPEPEARGQKLSTIYGRVPSSFQEPKGCSFHPRCSRVMDICSQVIPENIPLDVDHKAACHLYN